MKRFFLTTWRVLERTALFIGNIITALVMVIFYFTIFALFAIPFRLLTDVLKRNTGQSTWVIKKREFSGLDDFRQEF